MRSLRSSTSTLRPVILNVSRMKRILPITLGVAVLALVALIGFYAKKNPEYGFWFGIGAAVVAPLGVFLIGAGLSSKDRQVLEKLSKVPEIASLIEKAKNHEIQISELESEKNKLQEEKVRLLELIEQEARRESLLTHRNELLRTAGRTLNDLDSIDTELRLFSESVQVTVESEALNNLRKKLEARREGDVVIPLRSVSLILRREWFLKIPFIGQYFYDILRLYIFLIKVVSDTPYRKRTIEFWSDRLRNILGR